MILKTEKSIPINKKYKLIVLDVDGTLINSNHIITVRTLNAIKMAKDAGIRVTIATGRHYYSVIRIARKIQINAPLICSDGAIIKDIYSNKALYNLIPQEIAVDIIKMAKEYKNFKVQIFTKDGKIFAGKSYRNLFIKSFIRSPFKYTLKGYFNLMRDFVFIPVKNTGDIDRTIKILKEPPAKVVVSGNERPEDLKDFKKRIINKYGDNIFITSSIDNCIDILKGGISKAKGIEIVTESLGIKRQEVVTVGDNFNDIEMIKYAGLGVAMGNAPVQVKERADFITESNNRDGLALFLENLLKNRITANKQKYLKNRLYR